MSLTPRLDKLERNLLINGGMALWQRAGASVAVNTGTSLAYSGPDRFLVKHAGTFTGSPNIVKDTNTPDTAFGSSLKHSFQRSASTATFTYEQRVESALSADLSVLGSASLSFYVRADIAGSIVVTLYTPTVQDNHTSQTQIYQSTAQAVTAGSWQLISLPAIAITSSANLGLAVNIQYSTASGTDGTVQTFRMTRTMLVEGSNNANFQRFGGSHIADIAACQRYYEKSLDLDTVPGTVSNYFINSKGAGVAAGTSFSFRVIKRIAPAVNLYSASTGTLGQIRDLSSGVDRAALVTVVTTVGVGDVGSSATPNGNFQAFNWTADCEL